MNKQPAALQRCEYPPPLTERRGQNRDALQDKGQPATIAGMRTPNSSAGDRCVFGWQEGLGARQDVLRIYAISFHAYKNIAVVYSLLPEP